MDELKQQMEQLRQSFKMEDFKLDQKQMDELKKQMEELRKTLPDKLKEELNRLDLSTSPGVSGRA